MTGRVFIATTVDGFVARQEHRMDWVEKCHHPGVDLGFERFMGWCRLELLLLAGGALYSICCERATQGSLVAANVRRQGSTGPARRREN